ncbi:hypothetical protein [Streptomyces sp. NPDC003077]|uniref:hypothetical protein n=1 Tax=Streptomyces sp. NPDC003077 TaxID=3154443 RepID=UPI0033A1F68F
MAKIQVLLDEAGNVLGTTQVSGAGEGEGAPESVGVVPGPGQRVIETEVVEQLLEGSPASLHAHLKSQLTG